MNPWEQYATELVIDLYELTMGASYLEEDMFGEATFSLFIRDYPRHRAFFVSAGLERLLDMISGFRFHEDSLRYLELTGKFKQSFLDYLREFRFTGTIRAIPEGRLFFTQEPVLEVTAPIIEGQLIETLIINTIQLETMIAGKAARCVHAARGRGLIDFGLRRTHGVDAGVGAARATYLAGFLGTSNVLAGKIHGIPIFGTMAHSYVTSFRLEMDAFLAFARTFPDNTVLLIDTYDTVHGARQAVEVARRLATEGKGLLGVRLDSGDLVALSREVRHIFREAGFPQIRIMASGGLDEIDLRDLLEAGAEIDIFAVGTRVGVSADAPYLDMAYKLVEFEGRPVLKLSSGKKTWVGRKQVYRFHDHRDRMEEDVLSLLSELPPDGGEPLLQKVMENGERLIPPESLQDIRSRFASEWEKLPEQYRKLEPEELYPVAISQALQDMDRLTVRERKTLEGWR